MSNSSENEDNNVGNNNNEESNRPACAACKHQRKKCKKACPFSLHFPANRHQEFAAVHQIFGIANMNKMMKGLDLEKQGEVVKSIIWEAMVWTNKDHREHGPYGLYKRLEEENKQLKEQLVKSQQEPQSPPKPHAPGIVSKSSWQEANCTDVRGFPKIENYSSYSHGNENLLLNSTVNSYSSLLEGYNKEAQGSITNSSHPAGLGFPAALPPPSLSLRQEQQTRESRQEKCHEHAILPLNTWAPRHAMLPQSTRPGATRQARGINQVRNLNASNYSGPSRPHLTSLESRRLGRYYPFPLPQYPPSSMQKNPPQPGFILGLAQQYPLINPPQNQNLSINPPQNQNNISDQHNRVNPKAAQEDSVR